MQSITFQGDWKAIQRMLTKDGFERRLEREVGIATATNARLAVSTIKLYIRRTSYAPNAPLTRALKHSSRPLVETGMLRNAITYRRMAWNRAFVGVQRSGSYGGHNINLAWMLHEGYSIKVTPKMRGMFNVLSAVSRGLVPPSRLYGRAAALYNAAPGFQWRGLRPSTNHIRIPSRPFIRAPFNDGRMRRQIQKNWYDAVIRAVKSIKRGSP